MNNDLLAKIKDKLGENRLFYVCRDIERAESLCSYFNSYLNSYIITNKSPYSLELKEKYPDNIILVESNRVLDTHEILALYSKINTSPTLLKEGETKINKSDFVMVFKNTKKIERICEKNNWNLINPSAEIASVAEEKISQIKWLGELKKYLPGYEVKEIKDIEYQNYPFIIQFNHSHTGSGTILINSNGQLEELKNKFPNREARIAKYIEGPLITNNNIVWGENILMGNISYQITGIKPFTNREFATIGNDWALPNNLLNKTQLEEYKKIVKEVGGKLIKSNWKGLFGVDIVLEEAPAHKGTGQPGKLYLLEINARQPASTSCESWLQENSNTGNPPLPPLGKGGGKNFTTFDAHLMALLEIPYNDEELIKINNGAQIILRNTDNINKTINYELLTKNYKLVEYENEKEESDWLRIESKNAIMDAHNVFNKNGKNILSLIS